MNGRQKEQKNIRTWFGGVSIATHKKGRERIGTGKKMHPVSK